MFSGNSLSSDVATYYDFEENAKWKKVFISSLEKMLVTLHPTLSASDEALDYMENLVVRLLAMVCGSPMPHTWQDVEDRVLRVFPAPINRYVTGDAQAAVEKSKKKSPLLLPTDRVHHLLKDALHCKLDFQVTVYALAVLEYISHDILKLAGIYVKGIHSLEVTQQDIRTAMCADQVLMKLMDMVCPSNTGEPVKPPTAIEEPPVTKVEVTLTYDELVKDLIEHEKAYIRELNMISKVFRNELMQIPAVQARFCKNVEEIFSNIDEIYDFSVNLLGSLEDTIEVTKEDESPAVGSCFEELAEGQEFHVYLRYFSDVVPEDRSQEALTALVKNVEVWEALSNTSYGEGFRDAVLYYLPRLLHLPIIHIFSERKYIEELMLLAESCIDSSNKDSLEQVEGLLCPLYSQLERELETGAPAHLKKRLTTEVCMKASGQTRRQALLQKLNDIQRSIEGWEGKDITQLCNSLVLEGDLKLVYPGGRKHGERHVFLFDGLLVLCKQKVAGFRLKEKYLVKNINVIDREDSEDAHCAFEIQVMNQQNNSSITLSAKTQDDKNNWMYSLVMILRRGMLERALDSILTEEEQQHPLRLPDPSVYPFSEPDSEENIIIEERDSSATPLIKGASLIKLIERLTYHMYADPMFVRTFLTTYRSFCSSSELLELLKKRFNIPELVCCGNSSVGRVIEGAEGSGVSSESVNGDLSNNSSNINKEPASQDGGCSLLLHREGVKRFRKQYVQPVQFRVLNVLRHWVDSHFYDFERDSELLDNLTNFLNSVQSKSTRKWVVSITKIIQRKRNEESREITFSQNRTPPSPKYHMKLDEKDWEIILPGSAGGITPDGDMLKPLLMLHPIEVARQLTLLEFDLYRSVKPSELVGKAWTKDDKERRSPNLLKMIHHTNNVTRWVMRCICDCENFEERVAAMTRVVEIMIMLYDLNNFSGLFEMTSALASASVHRLDLTKAEVKRRLPPNQKLAYEEAMELTKDHYKKYLEKLRSINPPCVPFFGIYLTNIIHIDVGNPDVLPPHNLINFSKRRKVADITGEIQQYQNQAYCLQVEPSIKRFLENLNPFDGMDDAALNNYLYNKSIEVEPKNSKKPLVKERRLPQLSLKSPGIKTRTGRSLPNPINNMLFPKDKDSSSTEGSLIPSDLSSSQPPTPSTPCTPPAYSTSSSTTLSTTSTVVTATSSIACTSTTAASTVSTIVAPPSLPPPYSSTITCSSGPSAPPPSYSAVMGSAPPHPTSYRQERAAAESDEAVFAMVEIGTGSISGTSRPSISSISSESTFSIPCPVTLPPPPSTPGPLSAGRTTIPPPLPPRSETVVRRREASLGDTSPKVSQSLQAPDAPEIPPRNVSPPPIPPRYMHSSNTLPHKHTSSAPLPHSLTPGLPSVPPHSTHFPYNPPPHSTVTVSPVMPHPGVSSISSSCSSSGVAPPHSSLPSKPPHLVQQQQILHHAPPLLHRMPPHPPVLDSHQQQQPGEKRRNNSMDMSSLPTAPPLSRRHTTNGPPHCVSGVVMEGSSPPTPPPRLPSTVRPTSITYETHHHHHQQQHL